MRIGRGISPDTMAAVAPLLLLAIALLFLTFIWLGYVYGINDHYESRLRFFLPVGSLITALTILLAYFGSLVIGPTKEGSRQGPGFLPARVGAVMFTMAGIAVPLLIVVMWGYLDHPSNLPQFILVASTTGMLVFSLAYLGFLLTCPAHSRAWNEVRAIESSIILYLFAVMGSRFWYRYFDDPQWHILLVLSPLVFFLPVVPAILLGGRTRRETKSSSAGRHSGSMGLVYLSTYVLSLSLYLLIIRHVGPALGNYYSLYHIDLNFNMVFWFLLPVHTCAVLIYTVACGKGGSSWVAVVARLVLSGVLVLLSFRAMEIVDWRYG